MIIELGHFALIAAFCVAIVQAFVPLYGAMRNDAALMRIARPAALVQCGLLCVSFTALMVAFIRSDFSLALVIAHSSAAKPLIYKIAGVWGNHEGSMLLWTLMLALYGAIFAITSKASDGAKLGFQARVLSIQAMLGVAFTAFILWTSNPFARVHPPQFEGQGLNPVLQDPALALHPPLLYAGYVGFSIGFAIAIAALLTRPFAQNWVQAIRPWVLAAWVFLTLGIALGSFWAYYELGWGGFWFWDPVENASLMPWLTGTALIHSTRVAARRNVLHRWCLILAIISFGLALAGTFLVRSGVLTSVHAFANDPARGIFILLILVGFIGGGLLIYARAMRDVAGGDSIKMLSREGALIFNNLMLAVATATVFVGTLYPLALDALGFGKISVGAPYFSSVLTPLLVPFVCMLPLAPLLRWRGEGGAADLRLAMRRLSHAAILSLLIGLGVVLMRGGAALMPALGLMGAAWLIFGGVTDFLQRIRFGRQVRFHVSMVSAPLAHAGIGVMLLGIIGATAWRVEVARLVVAGDIVEVGVSSFRFEGVSVHEGANYTAERARLVGLDDGVVLLPERRFYEPHGMLTTEAAIDKTFARNIYAVIGDEIEGKRVVRIWIHPLVVFIWVGSILMAFGGIFAFIGFRLQTMGGGRL